APAVLAKPAAPAQPRFTPQDRTANPARQGVPLRANSPDAGKLVPDGVTRRSTVGVKGFERTRVQVGGGNGANVQEQVVDITNFGPTVSDEIDPYWSADEQFIFFAANRDFTGDNTPDNYQLWRIASNPSANQGVAIEPARLTNQPGALHRFPSVSSANRIAFIKSTDNGATYQLFSAPAPAGATSATPAANIPAVTISPNLTSLTAGFSVGTGGGARSIQSVGRPAWLSATEIIFTARLSDGQSDVLIVDVQTGLIRPVTNSLANEDNVAVSPDGRYLAFDSNATGYSPAGPAASTGTTGDGTRNVFVSTNFGANAIRVTAGAGSGVAADVSSVQPAWSRSEVTPFFETQNNFYLAFSSDRVPAAAPAAGFTKNPNGTKDIYYARVITPNVTGTTSTGQPIIDGVRLQLEGDAAGATFPGIRVVAGNVAPFKLDTNDTDSDSPSRWDDAYPTFPPLLNAIRIAFQSDRKGSTLGRFTPPNPNTDANRHDIFLASVLDLFAPTLLRYDLSSPTGEVVHINLGNTFNPSVGASVRNRTQGLTPGTDVFFTVRGEDLESGINSAYIQIKNPNSKYQSQAQGGNGVEHKEFAYGAFAIYEPVTGGFQPLPWEPNGNPAGNVGLEYECQVLGASDSLYYSHGLVPGIRFGGGAGLNVPSNARSMYDAGGGIFTIPEILAPAVVGDDGQAFSGTAHPAPLDAAGRNIWVRLQRIDMISAELATQYPGGRDGNGGVLYGAVYRTSGEPSDWFLDVIFYDNAVNPFDPNGSQGNWIIYDNVWGFSTAPSFNASPVDVLVVSDYMLGQKFLAGRLNRRGASGQESQRPEDNLPNIVYGGESYITDTDVKRFPDGQLAPPAPGSDVPRRWEGGAGGIPGGPFLTGPVLVPSPFSPGNGGTPNPLGVGSYIDDLLIGDSIQLPGEGTDGTPRFLPSVGRYNIWRVLSRGPVPANVLNDYLPFTTTAPPDTRAGQTVARNVRNVNRMVIWASAFTQTAFRGVGTIADLQTQQDLTNYVNAGGQLFVSGQDVAFALAGNGQSSPFVNQVLGVGFNSNNVGGAFQLTVNTPALDITPPFNLVQRGSFLANRIGRDSLTPGVNSAFHINGGTIRNYSPPGSEPLDLQNLEDLLPASDWRGSASGTASARAGGPLFNGFNDVVTAQGAPTTPIYGYGGGGGMFVNPNPSGGTAVFASFGFESLTEGFYTYTPPGAPSATLAWRGRRSEIMHNITDSLRTATITGRVLDDNNSPVTDALIRVANANIGLGVGTAPDLIPAEGTALTDGDGNYQVTGIAGGFVLVEAFKAGFYTQVSTGNVVHGASRTTVNLIVKRAGPGRLAGIQNTAVAPLNKTRPGPNNTTRTVGGVFESDDITPIAGVPVLAYFAQAGAGAIRYVGFATVTSDGNQRDAAGNLIPVGQYVFPQDLPIGNYQVVANTTRVIDANGQLVENTGQTTVTINGQAVQIPVARNIYSPNVYVDNLLVGRRGPGLTGVDVQGDDLATPINEATLVVANPNKTADLPGDFVVIEENKGGGVDFRLSAGAQAITGFVLSENADGSTGPGVPGVTVRATLRGSAAVVGEAVTGEGGAFTLTYNNNTPGDTSDDLAKFPENVYTVFVAAANGFDLVAEPTGRSRRPSVDVNVGGDTNVTIVLQEPRSATDPLEAPGALIIERLPPGRVSGLVVTRLQGSTPTAGA
ncbi:MAG: carboxypeptidase regulatory-like domain-containing protein, partial [Fibrella sp.]|nr:carboxypeptidase regulatory-like domain-containing protein [Armatimonadota bacterium]